MKKKNKPQRAQCRFCGKKFFSLTTNPGGKIICPKCDRTMK